MSLVLVLVLVLVFGVGRSLDWVGYERAAYGNTVLYIRGRGSGEWIRHIACMVM